MFDPLHYGLFFSPQQAQRARQHERRVPLREAWARLRGPAPTDPLARAQWAGLRYRLEDDPAPAAPLLSTLADLPHRRDSLPGYPDSAPALVAAQCVELLRDHPELPPATLNAALDALAQRAAELDSLPADAPPLEALWRMAFNAGAGVALADEARLQAAAAAYRQTVDRHIHPEGYLPGLVAGEDHASLERQLMATQALTLTAEIAEHAGLDLWRYHLRGVSALTAVTYPLYYYFYPEKWPWSGDESLSLETTQPLFQARAGYLEMAANRYERPLRAIQMILDESRPVVDVLGGGLPTLTHAPPQRRGLFG